MNKQRRKQIEELNAIISDTRAELEDLRDIEQDMFDNMPEAFKQGDRGSISEEGIFSLDDAIRRLEEAEASLESAQA